MVQGTPAVWHCETMAPAWVPSDNMAIVYISVCWGVGVCDSA